MTTTFLHLGANKAASTTLQRSLLSKTNDLVYLGEDCENFRDYQRTLSSLTYDDDFNFNFSVVEKLFSDFMSRARNLGLNFVYSNEDIMTSRVPSQVLTRMKKVLPGAKIFIILRNQLTAIPSWYANHGAFLKGVPRRYWRSFVSADDFMEHFLEFFNYSPLDAFMYHKLLCRYGDAFGDSNIKFFLFEDLLQDSEKFWGSIANYLGVEPKQALKLVRNQQDRPRITQRRFSLHKFTRFVPAVRNQRLPPFIENFIDSGPPVRNLGMGHWSEKIYEIYKRDNLLLCERFGLDLNAYGYPVE